MSEHQVRIGILGTARIARRALIEPARAVEAVSVTAVAGRDSPRTSAYAAEHGIPEVYDSYEELLASPKVDAVYVPLPNALHAPWTLQSIAAGKHVLCEKPFTSNAAEAAEVLAAASATDLVVMEAMHYRYHPLVERLVSLVGDGAIGAPEHVQAWTSWAIPNPDDIRYDYALGGGALMDGGCYAIDCVRLVDEAAGPPAAGAAAAGEVGADAGGADAGGADAGGAGAGGADGGGAVDGGPGDGGADEGGAGAGPVVTGALADPLPGGLVDRSMAARLAFPGGMTGWFESSFTQDGEFRADVHVIGAAGKLWLENFVNAHEGRLVVTRETSLVSVERAADLRRYDEAGDTTFAWQLRAFAAAVLDGAPFPTTVASAVTTMRLIDEAYHAAGLPVRGAAGA
jgi:predicted dehydrogenase